MAKLRSIRKECAALPEDREERGINDILDFVRDVAFLTRLREDQLFGLCREMTLEVFKRGDTVFKMGDMGDKFYIILSGGVGVQVPMEGVCPNGIHKDDACTCPDRPLETVAFLWKGMSFGELALQSEEPRSATIVANEPSELLVTMRSAYEKFAGEQHRQLIEPRVRFLRKVPRIEEALRQEVIGIHEVVAMANCIGEKLLSGNGVAVEQDTLADSMIFVRSGQLLMLRRVGVECETAAGSRATSKKVEQEHHAAEKHSSVSVEEDHEEQNGILKTMMEVRRRHDRHKIRVLDGQEKRGNRHRSYWDMVRVTYKQAKSVHKFLQRAKEQVEAHDLKQKNMSKMLEQVPLFGPKRASQKPKAAQTASEDQPDPAEPMKGKRQRLLRTGTLGAFQFFGDEQLSAGTEFPVSLIADPAAHLYIIHKSDLRRMPKKMLQVLFTQETSDFDRVPNDECLVQMHQQTKRWETYRRDMHAQARMHMKEPYKRAPKSAAKGDDVVGKLEFLGVSADSKIVQRPKGPRLTRPGNHAKLSIEDEQRFTDIPARFLRRFEQIKNDPGVRQALLKDGQLVALERLKRHDRKRADEGDPIGSRIDEQWAAFNRDSIGLDLDEVLDGVVAPRMSMLRTPSTPREGHPKRGSRLSNAPSRRGSAQAQVPTSPMGPTLQVPAQNASTLNGIGPVSLTDVELKLPPLVDPGEKRAAAQRASAATSSSRLSIALPVIA